MWKAALAGAFALATIGSSLAFAQDDYSGSRQQVSAHSSGHFSEAHIAQARAVLHLTPAQRPYWAPVEAALRDLVHHQGEANGARVQRVMAAAQPLIGVLDDQQKQHALALARALGLGSMASAY